MADVYPTGDALLCDYEKLSQEYKNKAGRYIKTLLKIYRAENGIRAKISRLERPTALHPTGEYRCNFCGKSENETSHLIAGPNVFICDECARLCGEVLDEIEAEEIGHEEADNAEVDKGQE